MTPTPSERLKELGLTLTPPLKPAGAYSHTIVDGDRVWVSGQVVVEGGKPVSPGLVDKEVPVDVAKELARRAALQALSALAAELGSIDRVKGIVRATVYVASSLGFGRQPEVANGATELFIQIFGEAGRPARAAVGVASLPFNAPVEVECLARTI
jgi:enamine deaminase RidA (YjgF/YER057c/UK114 family)